MSIVALKRKSARFISPISNNVGPKGFSLNGGHRNIGGVGRDTLSRSLSSTNMRCSTEDPSVIKKSTINTLGYLSQNIRFPISGGCTNGKCAPVNTMNNVNRVLARDHTQGTQIEKVANESSLVSHCNNKINTNTTQTSANFKSTLTCSKDCKQTHIGGRRVPNKFNLFSKNTESFTSMSAGEFTKRINKSLCNTSNTLTSTKGGSLVC